MIQELIELRNFGELRVKREILEDLLNRFRGILPKEVITEITRILDKIELESEQSYIRLINM